MNKSAQFGRKWSLIVADQTGDGIDLSQLRIKFNILQSDQESPNTANIRVYNLSDATVRKITSLTPVEYNRVVLQAGYNNDNYGIIFDGTIKQFRRGRENNKDTYLDILAAEGDIPYNYTFCNKTLSAEAWDNNSLINEISSSMGMKSNIIQTDKNVSGGTKPRGKVLFGMGKTLMRAAVQSIGSTWSINNGVVQVIPLKGYLPSEAVVLNSQTGLIGTPEQTDEGIKLKCLLNPKIIIGGRIKINNADINQLTDQSATMAGTEQALPIGQVQYNTYGRLQLPASIAADGMYRVFVSELEGDTRGNSWYNNIVALAIDESSNSVIANN